MIPKPIAIAIVCIVTFVWLAAFVAQFLVPGYRFDGYLHTVFLIIVGGALGLSRKNGNDKDGPPTSPPGAIEPPTGGSPAPPDPEPPHAGGAHRASFALLPRVAI